LAPGAAVLWTYDVWTDVTLVAGELRDPARDLWRTALIGSGVLVALYVAVQLSVPAFPPAAEAAASGRVFAAALERPFGAGAGRAVALLVLLCTFGSVNAIIL